MKRILIILLTVVTATVVQGQGRNYGSSGSEYEVVNWKNTADQHNKSASTSRWYSLYNTFQANGLGTEMINGGYPLHPDTTTRTIVDGVPYEFEVIAGGQVFDPTSNIWLDQNGYFNISDQTPYLLDSLSFIFKYFRPQGGNADTLLVQVYKKNVMTCISQSSSVFSHAYCTPDYDAANDRGIGAAREYTVILDNSMVSSTNTFGRLVFDVNLAIAAGEQVAMSMHFKPGNPVTPGGSIATYANNQFTGQGTMNSFLGQWFGTMATAKSLLDHNYSLDVMTDWGASRYPSSWSFDFAPGVYYNTPFQMNVDFKITFENTTGIASQTEKHVSLYPNPSSGRIQVEGLEQETPYRVFDQLGRELRSGKVSPSANRIDLTSLAPGQYFMHIEGKTEMLLLQ